QRRYATYVWMEDLFRTRQGGDYGFLISPACQILEEEVQDLLLGPARAIAGELGAALGAKSPDKVPLLEPWANGKPATLGTVSVVLLALRRGQQAGVPAVREFLEGQFRHPFVELLAANGVAPCLDRVREAFRNPACHGTKTPPYTAAEYEQFVRLLVGH